MTSRLILIGEDSNCFFHSISYTITATELQHMDVCRVQLSHGYYPPGYTSAEQYIQMVHYKQIFNIAGGHCQISVRL